MEDNLIITMLLNAADILYVIFLCILPLVAYVFFTKWKRNYQISILPQVLTILIWILLITVPYEIVKIVMISVISILIFLFIAGLIWVILTLDTVRAFYNGNYDYVFAKDFEHKILSNISKIFRAELKKNTISHIGLYFSYDFKDNADFYSFNCKGNLFKFIAIMVILKCFNLDIDAKWLNNFYCIESLDKLRQYMDNNL